MEIMKAYSNVRVIFCLFGLACYTSSAIIDIATDVKIDINQSALTANVSWKSPPSYEVKNTLINVFNSAGDSVYNSSVNSSTSLHYLVPIKLQQCMEYSVQFDFSIGNNDWLRTPNYKFVMSDTQYTSMIDSNITVEWDPQSQTPYSVKSPSGTVIYEVSPSGGVTQGADGNKYSFEQNVSSNINVTVRKVNESDAGLYISANKFSDNPIGCAFLTVTDTPETPRLSVNPETPFVGDNVTFTCNSSVRRWPNYVPFSLSYTYNGITDTSNDNTGTLIVKDLHRNQTGLNVTCTAIDDLNLESTSNTITINPYYGPDTIDINPNITSVDILEGETLGPYKCSSECNPPCNITWRKNITDENNMLPKSSSLSITNIIRGQSGTYICAAVHTQDKGRSKTKSVVVNVQHPPTITEVRLNGEVVSNESTFTLTEYKPLETVVKMESNPEAFLSFYKKETNLGIVNLERNNGYYNFTVSHLRCEDSGVYFIEASNNVKNNSVRAVVLNVECEPKSITLDKYDIGTVKGAIINFTVSVVANPKPTIAWKPSINHTWEVTEVGTNQYRGFSRLEILDEESFGIYNVEICGRAKCVVENITIKAEGKPDAPWNLTVIEVSHSWVNVSFIAGFDGGLDQSFSVQCRPAEDLNNNLIDQIIKTADRSKNTKIYHSVEGLIPNTKYNFTLTAQNSLGSTSIDMDFITNKAPVSKSTSMTVPVGVVGAGSGAGVAVLAVAIVAIVVFRRRKMIAKESKAPPPVELSDINLPEPTAGGSEYASVLKTTKNETHGIEMSNEYAEVAKSMTRPMNNDEMNSEYAEVFKVKKSSRNGKGLNQDEATDESLYANRDVSERSRLHHSKNADSLIYIEVEFTKPPSSSNGRLVIHGDDERTDYVDIDFSRRADPLPDSDPEDNSDSGH